MRVDEESTEDVTSAVGQDVLSTFKALLEGASRPDVVILEDYDKGLLTEDTVAALIAACQQAGVPVAVDPKLKRFQAYQGVALFKPNLKELNEGLGLTEPVHPQQTSNMAKAVERLRSDLGCARVMVTLGEHGTWIHAPQEDVVHVHIPAVPREVMDVSGAGDMVLAALAAGLAFGFIAVQNESLFSGLWLDSRSLGERAGQAQHHGGLAGAGGGCGDQQARRHGGSGGHSSASPPLPAVAARGRKRRS